MTIKGNKKIYVKVKTNYVNISQRTTIEVNFRPMNDKLTFECPLL